MKYVFSRAKLWWKINKGKALTLLLHDDRPTNAFTKLQLENWNLKISLDYLQIIYKSVQNIQICLKMFLSTLQIVF